jgi:hypothetical protein
MEWATAGVAHHLVNGMVDILKTVFVIHFWVYFCVGFYGFFGC